MPVVVEVADDGHTHALLFQTLHDVGNSGGGSLVIHRNAHQFGASTGQGGNLLNGSGDVGGVSVGHGLDHDRNLAADPHCTYGAGVSLSALGSCHPKASLACGARRPVSLEAARAAPPGLVSLYRWLPGLPSWALLSRASGAEAFKEAPRSGFETRNVKLETSFNWRGQDALATAGETPALRKLKPAKP